MRIVRVRTTSNYSICSFCPSAHLPIFHFARPLSLPPARSPAGRPTGQPMTNYDRGQIQIKLAHGPPERVLKGIQTRQPTLVLVPPRTGHHPHGDSNRRRQGECIKCTESMCESGWGSWENRGEVATAVVSVRKTAVVDACNHQFQHNVYQ
ncbi:unnamed protein product [Protopolystoma xenopodis]|uniref:Uncharacterized protein n=1 Tax=Protopolystoma xenopodis TaxID=117903 RepID=A0A448XM24_9PLAT|nr:unnamed protein product [Protopolystoma xenopodis]